MQKPLALVCFCFPLMAFAAEAPSAEKPAVDAQALNAQGYKHYKAGEYKEAVESFKKAVAADHATAKYQYNLACSYALWHEKNPCRSLDRYGILKLVEKTIRLKSSYREKMQVDPDLKCIRDLAGYHVLLGLSPSRPDDLNTILDKTSWYGGYIGDTGGPSYGLDFGPDGQVVMSRQPRAWWVRNGSQPLEILGAGGYKITGDAVEIVFSTPVPVYGDGGNVDISRWSGTIDLSESGASIHFKNPDIDFGDTHGDCDSLE